MRSPLVAGVDSSTQHTKIIAVDTSTGSLMRSSALPHPEGTEVHPDHWWTAFEGVGGQTAFGATAISVAAQQHSTIFLDAAGEPVREALLWNDIKAAEAGAALRAELGAAFWLDHFGLLPDSAHPVSKLRWLSETEPEQAARVEQVLLPHDWITWKLLGAGGTATTDRSDASATGYWSPLLGRYDDSLIERSFGRPLLTPTVIPPSSHAGITPSGIVVGAGCGDNAATHLSLDTQYGDVVVSVGTSTTVSMRTRGMARDPRGRIDTMADARSGYIPIIVMLNGARVISATSRMLGLDLETFDRLALLADRSAKGAVFLPYLDGERNPPRPFSRGALSHLSRENLTPETIARATILGLGCTIADAIDLLSATFGPAERVFVVGGGARSASLREVVADLTGRPIYHPANREHAAFGAARQAAWALTGELPQWTFTHSTHDPAADSAAWVSDVRSRYQEALLEH